MGRTLHAEWTKLRTLRSTAWLAASIAGAIVLVSALSVAAVSTSQCPSERECFEDTTKLSLSGVQLGQAIVVVLAVLAVSNEYGTGMIRTTLAANPRRRTVFLGKAAAVAAVVLAAGALGVLGSIAAGRAILPGNGFTTENGYPALSLGDGPTARAAVGSVLYLTLIALFSLGLGTAIRDTAGGVTTALAAIYISPVIAGLLSDPGWEERLRELSPMTAGLSIQATTRLDQLPVGPWTGLGVLAAYAAGALLLGCLSLETRDA